MDSFKIQIFPAQLNLMNKDEIKEYISLGIPDGYMIDIHRDITVNYDDYFYDIPIKPNKINAQL